MPNCVTLAALPDFLFLLNKIGGGVATQLAQNWLAAVTLSRGQSLSGTIELSVKPSAGIPRTPTCFVRSSSLWQWKRWIVEYDAPHVLDLQIAPSFRFRDSRRLLGIGTLNYFAVHAVHIESRSSLCPPVNRKTFQL